MGCVWQRRFAREQGAVPHVNVDEKVAPHKGLRFLQEKAFTVSGRWQHNHVCAVFFLHFVLTIFLLFFSGDYV